MSFAAPFRRIGGARRPVRAAHRELVALLPGEGEAVPAPRPPAIPEGCAILPAGPFRAVVAPPPPGPGRRRSVAAIRQAVARAALLRQCRLEALMPFGAVLPVAPGTSAAGLDLDALAVANAPEIEKALARVAGQAQFQCMLDWDVARAPTRFAQAPELSDLGGAGQGRKSAGPIAGGSGDVDTALAALARRLSDEAAASLDAVAGDSLRLPTEPGGLLNLVLLVEQAAQPRLDAALQAIDDIWTDGFRLRLIGPAPAVSFLLGRIRLAQTGDVDQARVTLGIAADADLADVDALARARRGALKASRCGNEGIGFDEIDAAHSLLSAAGRLGDAPPGRDLPLLTFHRDGTAAAAAAPEFAEVA
ncbi:MAG: GvpL/GvpF family gas vesicle protein [Pseudomonadota bacterium]